MCDIYILCVKITIPFSILIEFYTGGGHNSSRVQEYSAKKLYEINIKWNEMSFVGSSYLVF
jgi:hypothetical protein